jgi:hypothetical protein
MMKKALFVLLVLMSVNSYAAHMQVVNQTSDFVVVVLNYFDINAGHVVELPDLTISSRESQSRDIGGHEADKRYFVMWAVKGKNGEVYCKGDQTWLFANETLEVKLSGHQDYNQVSCKSNR